MVEVVEGALVEEEVVVLVGVAEGGVVVAQGAEVVEAGAEVEVCKKCLFKKIVTNFFTGGRGGGQRSGAIQEFSGTKMTFDDSD